MLWTAREQQQSVTDTIFSKQKSIRNGFLKCTVICSLYLYTANEVAFVNLL
jgi:hypothetical protein